jgi:hypothetical protein
VSYSATAPKNSASNELTYLQNTGYTNNPAITTSELRNPETNAAFYVVRHLDSTSAGTDKFKLKVNTSRGARK